MEIVYLPEGEPRGDTETVARLQGTRNFERVTIDMDTNGIVYIVSQNRQQKAETRLLDDPGLKFVQFGNNPFKLSALLVLRRARDSFQVEVGDLPPIGSRRMQHPIAQVAHVTPFPESLGILDIRLRKFRFFPYPHIAVSQRSRYGAGARPVHSEHKKRRPGAFLIQVL